MQRMLKRNVLQLVNNGFDDRTLAKHQTVVQGHQSLFDVALEFGHQLNACGFQQLFCQLLREITFALNSLPNNCGNNFGTGVRSSVLLGVSMMPSPLLAVIHGQMQI